MSEDIVVIPAELGEHYINRIHEISDEIASVTFNLNEAEQIAESNWNGESGQAAIAVIQRFNERLKGIDNSLCDAMTLISGMSEEEV